MFLGFWDPIIDMFNRVLVTFQAGFMDIVALAFKFDEFFYGVFATLAGASDIFDESLYGNITNNIYAAFGVVVLFIIAYQFLLYIVDPEKSKGDISIEKMLKNIVVVFLLIILLNPIFSFANGIVSSIIEYNVIGKIIFNGASSSTEMVCSISRYTDKTSCEEAGGVWTSKSGADVLAGDSSSSTKSPINGILISVYSSLLDAEQKNTSTKAPDEYGNPSGQDNTKVKLYKEKGKVPDFVKCSNGKNDCTLSDIINYAIEKSDYFSLSAFASNWHYKKSSNVDGLTFHFFTGLIIAAYMAYVLVLFCFDLAVRIIKLGFYQIVAPLCVACKILPGSKKEIYTKWKSLTIKTYCLVFVRVFALYLGVYMLSLLNTLIKRVKYPAYCGGFCRVIVFVFIIFGILTIIKQIPKLIEELLGEETGLGSTVRDKFKEAGGFALAGAAAGLGLGAVRAIGAAKDRRKKSKQGIKDAKQELKNAKASKNEDEIKKRKAELKRAKKGNGLLHNLGSVAAGALSTSARTLGNATNGFGMSEWGKEFAGLGKNIMDSAQAIDDKRTRKYEDLDTKNKIDKEKENVENLKKELADINAQITLAENNMKNGDTHAAEEYKKLIARKKALVGVEADKECSIDELNKAEANKITELNNNIAQLENTLIKKQVTQKILVNLEAIVSGDPNAKLKASEEIAAERDKVENDIKNAVGDIKTKKGALITVPVETKTELVNTICGKDTPAAQVVNQLVSSFTSYNDIKKELSDLGGLDDAKFVEHLKEKGVLQEVKPTFAIGDKNYSSEAELKSAALSQLLAEAGSSMDTNKMNYLSTLSNTLSAEDFVKEIKSYGLDLPELNINREAGYKLNGSDIEMSDIINLKTTISSSSPGLVSELDKQTDIAISNATIPGDIGTNTQNAWFGDNIKTITDDNDYRSVSAAVDNANSFYRTAYPNNEAPTTAEQRKKIRNEADERIIGLRKDAANRRNNETINRIKNPSSKK